MSFDGDTLFSLLPALYRLRDARLAESKGLAHGPLQDLLTLVAEQLAVVEEDLDQLYDNQFIETCAPWVIPYIGDLIGYQAIKALDSAIASRSEVAHTISFRRRKGTVLVLEQLVRDVTGWGAHAVEFFKLLACTQYMNHIRLYNHYAPDLRGWEPREHLDSAFDRVAHTVDVRRIGGGRFVPPAGSAELRAASLTAQRLDEGRSRYNIQNIGIFLWSLKAYRSTKSPATPAIFSQGFRFSPLGADLPLFNNPVSQGSNITAPALPVNVPDRLRRRVLCRDIQLGAAAAYYGEGNSLTLYVNDHPISTDQIRVCDLSGDEGHWANLPVAGSFYSAALDPQLGRIALAPELVNVSPPPEVTVSFYYGFNADMGGGEYPRTASFTAGPKQTVNHVPRQYSTVQAALDALGGDGVVEITDSNSYPEPSGLQINVKAGGHIELRAADGCRPTLQVGSGITVTGGQSGVVELNGLWVAYVADPSVPQPAALVYVPDASANQLSRLGLTHCTLVPGWALKPTGFAQYPEEPTLVAAQGGLEVAVQKSIVGGIRASLETKVTVSDSIVDATKATGVAYAALDGTGPGGPLSLSGCTVVGKVHATLLDLVSNSIFWAQLSQSDLWGSPPGPWTAPLLTARKQEGCVRFSFLPPGAVVPRNFECVQQALGSPQPVFVSLRYGDPGYAKLFDSTSDKIRRGAEDGGEMGAFHFVKAPLREDNLRTRLQEYLPVALEFGIIYET